MRNSLAFLACLASALSGQAAVVVISNATAEPVNCKIRLGNAEPLPVTIAAGESKPIICGRTVEVHFEAIDGPKQLSLEPYGAYLFVFKKKTGLELMSIELVGKGPVAKGIPEAVPVLKPLRIPIKLLVDDSERRTKAVATAALKKRLDQANEVMLREANVTFESAETDEWTVDPAVTDLKSALADFEKNVKADPALLAIGFTSKSFAPSEKGPRVELPYAIHRGFQTANILIREGDPRTEPERVEVLVQQLGRWLGAIASPDPNSAMRLKLGDGRAIHAKFRIGFDPLNTLAVNIVAEELRKTPPKKLADWPQETQVRLARVYATLNGAMPEEPLNEETAALLERANLKAAAAALEPKPKEPAAEVPKPKAERLANAEYDSTRKVLKAIVLKAEENSRKAAGSRVKGDELTELYVKAAADVASTLEEGQRKKAFLYAVGIGLDDSDLARKMPVFGDLCKAVETDDERKIRVAVLGNPSVRYRRDLCQHFAISAAATALQGPAKAELVGLLKEVSDMERPGGSGFDFSDLCADFAGVEFAKSVLAHGEKLNDIRQKFTVAGVVPKVDDLTDGLSKAKFKAKFGSTEDPRFTAAVDDVRKRVAELATKK